MASNDPPGSPHHILNCTHRAKPACGERCWYYWTSTKPSPASIDKLTRSAADIAELEQKEGKLKAKQERQAKLREEEEIEDQLLGTPSRRAGKMGSNQMGVTVREAWVLPPYDKGRVPKDPSGSDAEAAGDMSGVDDIIADLAEAAELPKTPKTPQWKHQTSTRHGAAKKGLGTGFTNSSGSPLLQQDTENTEFTMRDFNDCDEDEASIQPLTTTRRDDSEHAQLMNTDESRSSTTETEQTTTPMSTEPQSDVLVGENTQQNDIRLDDIVKETVTQSQSTEIDLAEENIISPESALITTVAQSSTLVLESTEDDIDITMTDAASTPQPQPPFTPKRKHSTDALHQTPNKRHSLTPSFNIGNMHITTPKAPKTLQGSKPPTMWQTQTPKTLPGSKSKLATRMRDRIKSVSAIRRSQVTFPSQSAPSEAMPITPIKHALMAFPTPETQRRASAIALPATPYTNPAVDTYADRPDGSMAYAEGDEVATVSGEDVYPTPAADRTSLMPISDLLVPKLLFPTTSPTHREFVDGGFRDVHDLSRDDKVEDARHVPHTPVHQIIHDAECPPAPRTKSEKAKPKATMIAKKRAMEAPVYPEEDNDEDDDVDADGEDELPDLAVLLSPKTAPTSKTNSLAAKNKNRTGKLSPAHRTAKFPFKVSKPTPALAGPRKSSEPLRDAIVSKLHPARHLHENEMQVLEETKLIDTLHFSGTIPHPTQTVCGREVSLHDLYLLVNKEHDGYENVEGGDLWRLVAVGLGFSDVEASDGAAMGLREWYRDTLLNVEVKTAKPKLVDAGKVKPIVADLNPEPLLEDEDDAEGEAQAIFLSKLGAQGIEPTLGICGREIDLHLLSLIVEGLNGPDIVEESGLWTKVAEMFQFTTENDEASEELRRVYMEVLVNLDDDPIPATKEAEPTKKPAPAMKFSKASQKEFLAALARLSASTGKEINETIEICGEPIYLFDAWVVVKHKLGGLQNVTMRDLWPQAARLLDLKPKKAEHKRAPKEVERLWTNVLSNLSLKLEPKARKRSVQAGGSYISFRFRPTEVARLESVYLHNQNPSKAEREALATEMGVADKPVHNWFISRRHKLKKAQTSAERRKKAKQQVQNGTNGTNVIHIDDDDSPPAPTAAPNAQAQPKALPQPRHCNVVTCPHPSIPPKHQVRAILNALRGFPDSEQGNEAATDQLRSVVGDMLAVRENFGRETGEDDEMVDDEVSRQGTQSRLSRAEREEMPLQRKWPFVMGIGVAWQIRQEEDRKEEHSCGPQNGRIPISERSIMDLPDMEREALAVEEDDAVASAEAAACYARLGGGVSHPEIRTPPHQHVHQYNGPQVASDDSCESESSSGSNVWDHDRMTDHLKGLNAEEIRNEILNEFGSFSWENKSLTPASPIAGVDPLEMHVEDGLVQSMEDDFDEQAEEARFGDDVDKDVAMAEGPSRQDIEIDHGFEANTNSPPTQIVCEREISLQEFHELVNEKYGGYETVQDRDLWRFVAIGLGFGDVPAHHEVPKGLSRVYRERFLSNGRVLYAPQFASVTPQASPRPTTTLEQRKQQTSRKTANSSSARRHHQQREKRFWPNEVQMTKKSLSELVKMHDDRRSSSNLNSLLAEKNAKKSKKAGVELDVVEKPISRVWTAEAGTKDTPFDLVSDDELKKVGSSEKSSDAGEMTTINSRNSITYTHSTLSPRDPTSPAVKQSVQATPPQVQKKPTVLTFLTYHKGQAIVDDDAALDAFDADELTSRESSLLTLLSKGDLSIEMFHVRCALAAGEIDDAGKEVLQRFFDGASTFEEVTLPVGEKAGVDLPILGRLLRVAKKCRGGDGKLLEVKSRTAWGDGSEEDHDDGGEGESGEMVKCEEVKSSPANEAVVVVMDGDEGAVENGKAELDTAETAPIVETPIYGF